MAYCNSCLGIIKSKLDSVTCTCGVVLHKSCANNCLICGKPLCDNCSIENHYICNDCKKKKEFELRLPRIRRSHIEGYKSCPYSVYLELFKEIEKPFGKHAELGIVVHEIIDKWSTKNGCDTITLDSALNTLKTQIKAFNEENKDTYSYVDDFLLNLGNICLENYYNRRYEFIKNKIESESQIIFKIREDLSEISCTLDRILWDENDDIHIHDWKTGKPMTGKKLVEDLQPGLYLYAVYKKYNKVPKSFTLHYLQMNKDIVYNLVDEKNLIYEVVTIRNTYRLDINYIINEVTTLLEHIKNNKYDMPEERKSWYCNSLCWYGLSGTCSGSVDESWRTINEKYGRGISTCETEES